MKNAVWSDEELATLSFKDQILPSQPHLIKMYYGVNYYSMLAKVITSVLDDKGEIKFKVKLKDGMSYAAMGSSINTLHFLQFLIRIGGYKKVLELGTYIGISAMYMADAGAHVITIEKGLEFFQIANDNINNNGFSNKITNLLDDSIKFLKDTHIQCDLIFIDCAKESYKELLELSIKRLQPNGLIVIDDIFFQGDTLNDVPITEKGLGVKKCLEYAESLEEWEKVILPLGNGLLLLRKKS